MIAHHRRWIILGSLIGIVSVCSLGIWFVTTVLTHWSASYDDAHIQATVIRQANELLTAVAAHPHQPIPDDLPGYLLVSETCWDFLQEHMVQSNNIYTLTLAGYHNSRYDPYPVHDTIEAWLHVQFRDGAIGELFSFQVGMNDCKALRSEASGTP
jgi:hypothetical protein